MREYFSLITGLLTLGTEIVVLLSIMELPPFGKGGSDIIWGLPMFGLIVLALAVPGLTIATRARNDPQRGGRIAFMGLITNGLSLAVPLLLLFLAVIRAFL